MATNRQLVPSLQCTAASRLPRRALCGLWHIVPELRAECLVLQQCAAQDEAAVRAATRGLRACASNLLMCVTVDEDAVAALTAAAEALGAACVRRAAFRQTPSMRSLVRRTSSVPTQADELAACEDGRRVDAWMTQGEADPVRIMALTNALLPAGRHTVPLGWLHLFYANVAPRLSARCVTAVQAGLHRRTTSAGDAHVADVARALGQHVPAPHNFATVVRLLRWYDRWHNDGDPVMSPAAALRCSRCAAVRRVARWRGLRPPSSTLYVMHAVLHAHAPTTT